MIFNLMKPVPVDEPTMYLYGHEATADETADVTINGVGYVGKVLPKLPEWDKEQYPYAYLTEAMGWALIASSKPLLCQTSTSYNYNYGLKTGEKTSIIKDRFYYDRDKEHYDFYNSFSEPIEAEANAWTHDCDAFWANTNIYAEDGTLFLSASEPIPIYE